MTTRVRHTARIIHADKRRITLDIQRNDSDCAACAIKSLCSASRQSADNIEISAPDNTTYHVGDNVNVSISAHTTRYPTLRNIVIPCIIFVAVIAYGDLTRHNENHTALMATLVTAAYYAIILIYDFFITRLRSKTKITIN